MQGSLSAHQSSHCRDAPPFNAQDNGLGQLFRDYGEKYIQVYKPRPIEISMIRSIRMCKTPAMGGKAYICKGCGYTKYVYFGCGNSRCPKCQGVKRLQWQDKLAGKVLQCPYQHITFTLPKRLNRLAKDNPYQVYNCLFRSAWSSLKACAAQPDNLGAQPGAIMVLHTFGADLKYHLHVHALVTFGGMDAEDQWKWPVRKRKIVPYRQMRREFRSHFIQRLQTQYPRLIHREPFKELKSDLEKKSWCVHAEPPTTNTKVIREYLGRYVCRVGLSIKRFSFMADQQLIRLEFKDYRNTKSGQRPPTKEKQMSPLVAIHKIMQHCLPKYFQKTRYYGLHGSANLKTVRDKLPAKIKNNKHTIRSVFQILCALLKVEQIQCEQCGCSAFQEKQIEGTIFWVLRRIRSSEGRSPPDRLNKWMKLQQLMDKTK